MFSISQRSGIGAGGAVWALTLVMGAMGPGPVPTAFAEDGQPRTAPEPVRRALLIGINEYITDDYPDLRGARNDVETMYRILTGGFGFEPRHVSVLTDEDATRKGILAAFDRLVSQSRADDVVYVHFSGHGSQVEDLDGDEEDGKDETLLPHDARTEGVPDITDDELGAFLARLPARTAVVTLDSCHSGTATRGTFLTRSVPPDLRLDLYRKATLTPRTIVSLERSEGHVLMTGAAAHQFALDGPAEGRMHGFFTYALSKSLQSAGPAATPSDLHPEIRRTFDRFSDQYGIPVPEPQIEADPDRLERPLFGDPPQAAARPWSGVRPSASNTARLVKGATLNARPGAIWAIYPSGESEFAPGQATALGTVVAIEGDDAVLRIDTAGAKLEKGFRAVPSAPPPAERLQVRLTGWDDERAAAFRSAVLEAAPGTTFVAADAFAHFEIACDENSTCEVLDAAGLAVLDRFHVSDAGAASLVARRFDRALNAGALLALTHPLSRIRLDVALVGPGEAFPRRVWRPGDELTPDNSLQLEIRIDRDAYVTVVDVDAEGGINLLFPTPHAEEGFLPEGRVRGRRTVRIPDSLARDNAAGFHWPLAAPGGVDTIQVFATSDLGTAERIRRHVAGVSVRKLDDTVGAPATRGGSGRRGLAALRDELAAREVRPRGGNEESSAGPAGDWTSATVRIRILE